MAESFEEKLQKRIIEERKIKEISARSYIRSLRKLKQIMTGSNEPAPITELRYLNEFKEIERKLDSLDKITSKKTIVIAILAVLRITSPDNEELLKKYTELLTRYDKAYMEFLKTQKKTDTQKKNWASYEDILKVVKIMKADLTRRNIMTRTEDEGLTRKEYDDLQKYILLKTYLQFPLRNDFADMIVMTEAKYKKLSDEDKNKENYIVKYSRGKRQFHINAFKNAKALGKRSFEIPQSLNRLISHFFKFNKSGYFITLVDRETPISPNGLSQLLIRTFTYYLNKRISSSMLRHIIATHDAKGKPSIAEKEAEQKAIETKFLHSDGMHQLYVKKD